MKYLLLFVITILLFVSCPQGNTPPDSGDPRDNLTSDDITISRPENPESFLPPPAETNINGVMYVNEDGTLTIPDNDGELISVHVWMAKEDEYINSSFKGLSKYGMYVETTGTPPPSLASIKKSVTIDPYTIQNEPSLFISPNEMIALQSERNASEIVYTVGDVIEGIGISGQTIADSRTIDAKILGLTEHANFLVEMQEDDIAAIQDPEKTTYIEYLNAIPEGKNETRIAEYVRKFEAAYGRMEEVFGDPAEALGGKVNILIVNFPSGIYGTIVNGYALASFNQLVEEGIDLSIATAYHEIQHQITRSTGSGSISNLVWIDEGLAEYARHITTHDKKNDTITLLRSGNITGKSVLSWGSDIPSYNYSYLFVQYLVDRFGEGIIKKILNAQKPNVDNRLHEMAPVSEAIGLPFDEVFFDFAVAVAILGRDVEVSENEHPFNEFQTKYADEHQNFLGNASPRRSIDAGATTETVDSEGNPEGNKNTLNEFGPYQIYITWWKGDVDTIKLPSPIDPRKEVIKGAVFYDKR